MRVHTRDLEIMVPRPEAATQYLKGVGCEKPEDIERREAAQNAATDALLALAEVTTLEFAGKFAAQVAKLLGAKPVGRPKNSDWTIDKVIVARLPHSARQLASTYAAMFGSNSPTAAAKEIERIRKADRELGKAAVQKAAFLRTLRQEDLSKVLAEQDLEALAPSIAKAILDSPLDPPRQK